VSRASFTAQAVALKIAKLPEATFDGIRRYGPDVGWLAERAGDFLPGHWNRPQLGHCRSTPRSAGLQRCDHVLPLQQANGKRITGGASALTWSPGSGMR
jgi:hypothetical protein